MPPHVLAVALYLAGGFPWLVWGFCVPTVTLAHATFAINTLNHMFGSRRFETIDGSRNNWLTAVFAAGEGWHNNHHRYQRAARNGFYWWEFDPTWYVIQAMAAVGLASHVQSVPARIYAEARAGSPAANRYVMIGRDSSTVSVAPDSDRDGVVPDPRMREQAAHRSAPA